MSGFGLDKKKKTEDGKENIYILKKENSRISSISNLKALKYIHSQKNSRKQNYFAFPLRLSSRVCLFDLFGFLSWMLPSAFTDLSPTLSPPQGSPQEICSTHSNAGYTADTARE